MAYAMRVHTPGGPEAMIWEEVEVAAPGAGEVLVRNEAIGLNFLDVYFRSGRYPMQAPFVVGHEGAGVIEAVGAGVEDFSVGDRVAYLRSDRHVRAAFAAARRALGEAAGAHRCGRGCVDAAQGRDGGISGAAHL